MRQAMMGSSLMVVLLLAVGVTGCKTTQRTTFGSEEGNEGATKEDVDEESVTVLPDGRTISEGEQRDAAGSREVGSADGGGERSDAGSTGPASEVWVPQKGDFVLKDRETGSLWNVRGEAFKGPMKGKRLEQIPAFNSFWFAWSIFYDGSEIWQRKGSNIRNKTAKLETGETCLVPCDDIEMGCPGKDCIPALDYGARELAGKKRPKPAEMVEPDAEGASYLRDDSFVFGVVHDGEARAYPHNIYWWHEIHNDEIGGQEFSVSFCPLTGSGIVFDGRHGGEPIRFGVSGRLYKSNLVMFDPQTGTFWSQMLGRGVKGERKGERLDILPVVETTWERWREMYPETVVTSSDTGYGRNYASYPYGAYRTDHDNRFGTEPPQGTYRSKERVLGLPGPTKSESLAFAFPEMDALTGDRNVIYETFRGRQMLVVYEAEHRMAIPFYTEVDGEDLTLVGAKAP